MRTVRGLHGCTGGGMGLRGHAAEGKCPGCGRDIGVLYGVSHIPRQIVDGHTLAWH
ncbi:hypothetical protein SSP24_39880 [Streptomyces spinoverrucosus]|uniref:Uncharacterized protein n=1 Tax=Streptomyces spinoverrucosus TaxID=284043 RepID=A0A4Y3VIH4_9ACTN|nr:hypothetical protein SSP24_39880 [Streptomyces spinoverrucosus]GHB76257.1 hypothetical protein GCM10010397_53450 [Streptomyces spinoverrucosus]